MKTLILKKIFSLISIVLGMFQFTVAEAQIIYTVGNPDLHTSCFGDQCSNSYLLDVNNDGILDFDFWVSTHLSRDCGGVGSNIGVKPLNSNSISTSKFALNNIIDENVLWSSIGSYSNQILYRYEPTCNSTDNLTSDAEDCLSCVSDSFLPLKIIIDNKVYYGWLRLSVYAASYGATFIINDFAYNSQPDQPIFAGQDSSLSVDDFTTDKSQFIIYPNPVSNLTTISFSLNQSEKVALKIFDLNGRLVTTLSDKMFEMGENNVEWNASGVCAGLYLLRFQSAGNVQTKKFIVMK